MTNDFEKHFFYKKILLDKSECKIWKKLENGCYIGTLGYSEENVKILYELLKSFAEQYGELITMESASEELALYQERGKLFIYFDEQMNPVSMNGITYNEKNDSVLFASPDNRKLNNIYFYGLSTLHSYRGKGACSTLVSFVKEYAIYNCFDFIYARTDLVGSNSEGIMKKAGMEICKENGDIIAEWVDVTDTKGDYRMHLWIPLKEGLYLVAKDGAQFADGNSRKLIGSKVLKEAKK